MFKMSKNALILFSSDVIARILGMLAFIYIARVLKADNFGIITIGFSFLFYSIWFSDLGLGLYGTREFARLENKRPIKLGEILIIKMILAAIVFFIMSPIISLFYENETYQSVIQLFLLVLFSDALMLEWYFKGIRKYYPILINRTIFGIVYLILVFFFINDETHTNRVPVFYFLANLFGAVFILGFKNKDDVLFPVKFNFKKYLNIIKSSFKMGLGGILAQIIRILPPVVLGIYYTSYEAGLFGAAMKIVTLTLIIDRIFISLFLPKMTNILSNNQKNINESLTILLKFIIITGFSVSITISIFSKGIINLILGNDYIAGEMILMVLSWFLAATLINSVFAIYLIAIGKENGYLKATIKGGIASVLLITVLSYYYSILGASIGVVLSEISMIIFMYSEFNKIASVNFIRSLLFSIIISSILFILSFFINLSNIWLSPLVWLFFIVLAVLFKAINKEDLLKIISYEKNEKNGINETRT